MFKKSTKTKNKEPKIPFKQKFSNLLENSSREMADFRENHFKRFLKWIIAYLVVAIVSLFLFNSNSNLWLEEFPYVLALVIPRMTTLFLFTCPALVLKKPKSVFVFLTSLWFVWYGIAFEMLFVGFIVALVLLFVAALAFFAEKNRDYSQYRPLFFKLYCYLLYSLLMVFVLQIAQMKSFVEPFEVFLLKPDVLACNLLCFAAIGSFVFWVRRPKISLSIYTIVWIILGIISFCKSLQTYEPVMFLDIYQISEGVEAFFHFYSIIFVISMFVLAFLAIGFLVFLALKEKKKSFSLIKFFSSLLFVIIVLGSLGFVSKLELMATESKTGKIEYDNKGFVYGFIFYSVDSFVLEPEGYDPTIIKEINLNVESEYLNIKEGIENVQNVIVIQLESFTDPYLYPGLTLERDPMPFIHSLMKDYTSGYVKVPVFGGQTVKSEFEFLTGLAIENLPMGYNPYVTYIDDNAMDSIVRYFDKNGFETTAIHNYQGEFFSRNEVYENLGFDYYIPHECMPDIEKKYNEQDNIVIWGNDSVFVNHIEQSLDNNGDEKNFVLGITVQMHGAYNPIPEDEYTMNFTGIKDKDEEGSVAYYVQQLEYVDKMVEQLVKMLSERDENTYVIFYGDHLPSIFTNVEDYMTDEERYTTPYFTWNNMGISKSESSNAEINNYVADIDLYQLSTLMCNELNIHGCFMNKFHNVYKDSKNFEKQFSFMQYYKFFDENKDVHFQNDTYQIGLKPLIVENIYYDDKLEKYVIKGSGFTHDTYIHINKSTIHLNFVDENTLTISEFDKKTNANTSFDLRIVGGRNSGVFRKSDVYKWGSVYEGSNQ